LPGSTSKKVLAVRFDREPVAGFIDPQRFLQLEGIEILSPSGTITTVPYHEVKALCYVRDFESILDWRRDRLFVTRPKMEGLWVRFRFRDGDFMDGLLPNNLLLTEPQGYTVAPPEPTFQNQRIFVPRAAVAEVRVLGVVGTQARRSRQTAPEEQLTMFDNQGRPITP
jgi:hypothetical protein